MKKLLLGLVSILLLNFVSAQNGDCTTPSTVVQNDANATPPGTSFNQCITSPIEIGGQIVIYSTVTSSADGTLGLIQSINYNFACTGASLNSLFSSRLAELFPANNCAGIPITPSTTLANTNYSSTFNPEWTGLTPSTNYTVRVTITVPVACTGMVDQVCLNQYYPPVAPTPSAYTCGTVDFSLSNAGPFLCTDPVVNLLAADPADVTKASGWVYPGFVCYVWNLPGFSWTNQKATFLDNGVVVMTQAKLLSDTLVIGYDHVQPGNYSFGITNIGARQFGYKIVNAADGTIAETGTFKSGTTVTGTHLPIGTWNYTIARVGGGAVATGVSNNPTSGGDGFFDPSVAGAGTFDITYSWDNGSGCSGSKTKQVVVTCPPPSCGTVGINWQTGSAPSALNLDCSKNTDYGLKANVITVAGNYIAPGFTIGDASGGVIYSKIEVEEGAGTGFVDVLGQKILTFCVPTFQYRIRLTGSGSGTVIIKDHATGNSIYSGAFTTGMIITLAPNTILGTATFSGPGVSNYKKSNLTVIGSGYGVFNPSVAGGGSHTITYSWDNGIGCSGTATIPVTVTCAVTPPPCGTVGINWQTGSAPSAANLKCTNNTDYGLKANIKTISGDFIAPGFTIEDASGAINYSKIEIEEGAGTGFVDVLGQKIITYCVPTLQYSLKLTGTGAGTVKFTDHATGTTIYSGAFVSGATIVLPVNTILGSAIFSGPGVSNYKLGSNTTIGSGYGVFNPSLAGSGTHDITYSWNNGIGCTGSTTIQVTIAAPAIPTASGTSICAGLTANLTASNGTTYNWYDAATTGSLVGSLALFTTPTLNVPTSYWVTTGSSLCESARLKVDVAITSPPTPTFNAISPICSGDALSLPSQSTDLPAITGTWTPAVDNTQSKVYTFTPTSGQCATTETMSIVVNQPIAPTFAAITPICSGDALSLPANSTNSPAIAGTWSPAIDNTQGKTYTFTPTSGQCALATSTLSVVVNQPVTPTFTAINPICSGDVLTLPVSPSNVPSISGTWSPNVDNTNTTTYTFTPNNGQCANNGSLTVVVKSNVTPTFAVIQPICSGDPLSLPGNSTNIPAISGSWTPAINNTQTTTYTFNPTAGQCVTLPKITKTVTVNQKVTPTFTAVNPICAGASLTALPTISNNSISGFWSPALDNTITKTYTFTPSSGQCSNSTPLTIVVNPLVNPTFTPVPDLCINSSAPILSLTSLNSITGTWSPSTVNTSNAGSTTYTFTPANNQCGTNTTLTIVIVPKPIANATPSVPTGHTVLNVDFLNLSSNNTSLNWDFGNGLTSTLNGNTSTSYVNAGNYTVTLTASNGVCPDAIWTQIIQVLPIDPLVVVVPNVFTPNNDGLNDEYFIDAKNAETFEATIFNRWGNEVISLVTASEKWNGKLSSGDLADEGTYFIKYKIVGLDKTVKEGISFFHLGL